MPSPSSRALDLRQSPHQSAPNIVTFSYAVVSLIAYLQPRSDAGHSRRRCPFGRISSLRQAPAPPELLLRGPCPAEGTSADGRRTVDGCYSQPIPSPSRSSFLL